MGQIRDAFGEFSTFWVRLGSRRYRELAHLKVCCSIGRCGVWCGIAGDALHGPVLNLHDTEEE